MPTYKNARVRDFVRTFNKHVTNPAMSGLAGHRYWYAAMIEHTGRKSGRQCRTPVVAVKVPDGMVVPLPYGVGVDWLRNVPAAGSATIVDYGCTYRVVRPEVIDAPTAEPQLSALRRRVLHASNVDSYVKFAPV
ncbi:nitroreductase [Mycobacterium sp. 94-17]|uniref:nitroreductase n=1 Tax=Mycobacterium sp. 94-17 TaxID=2986147 RepID=UPI002D1E9F0F|nr:nitroreductase [Mycobacterium sp. 94-17]MEB4212092.1 nitroreductase [Mycobacterium sp. 94-17]